MVEIKGDHISLSAVDARMATQIGVQPSSSFCPTVPNACRRVADVLGPIVEVVAPAIRAMALLTVVTASVRGCVPKRKGIEWFLDATT
jgi:hypothetical protein